MAGELQINGEYAGPWKLVASQETNGATSLSAYTTTQYRRLLFRMHTMGSTATSILYPLFYFLDDTGARRTDTYTHRAHIGYGTGYYSNQTTNTAWSPGWMSSNLRYNLNGRPAIFEMMYFNIGGEATDTAYLANWAYLSSGGSYISGFGTGHQTSLNPVYGIEMTTSNDTYTIYDLMIEVYGDTTLT